MATTDEIRRAWRVAHGPNDAGLPDYVSDRSPSSSDDWLLDTGVAGGETIAINLAAAPACLREAARDVAWSTLVSSDGRIVSVNTAARTAIATIGVMQWLDENGYEDLAEIEQATEAEFLEDLKEDIAEGLFPQARRGEKERASGVSRHAVYARLRGWREVVHAANRARAREMATRQDGAAGDDGARADLVVTFNAATLATKLSRDRPKPRPPIPDEVVDAILNAAERYIEENADTAGRRMEAAFAAAGVTTAAELADNGLTGLSAARNLLARVVAAEALLVLGAGGQRMSEYASARRDEARTGMLPSSVEKRPSTSTLYDLFYVHGTIFKNRSTPTAATWLIGSRPAGANALPTAVEAIATLEAATSVLRGLTDDERTRSTLAIGFSFDRTPKGKDVGAMRVRRLSAGSISSKIKNFIATEVDWKALPDNGRYGRDLTRWKATRGDVFSVGMLRKHYANYALRIDGGMVGAVGRQLKHISTATTERNYLSSDPTLLEDVEEASSRELARLMVSMARGEVAATGRGAALIERDMTSINRLTDSLDGEAAEVVMGDWLRTRGLGMFSMSNALCIMPLSPLESLCHLVAGTADWRQREPAHLHREEALCDKCACRVTLTEHVHGMIRNYASARRSFLLELRHAFDDQDRALVEREFRVALATSARIKTALEAMGHEVPRDEDLI